MACLKHMCFSFVYLLFSVLTTKISRLSSRIVRLAKLWWLHIIRNICPFYLWLWLVNCIFRCETRTSLRNYSYHTLSLHYQTLSAFQWLLACQMPAVRLKLKFEFATFWSSLQKTSLTLILKIESTEAQKMMLLNKSRCAQIKMCASRWLSLKTIQFTHKHMIVC